MLGPVAFFPGDRDPIEPYAVAPWAEEAVPSDTPTMVATLRGDWFCSAFGENDEPFAGRQLPPHGETANGAWSPIDCEVTEGVSWIKLGIDLPLQGGYCESTTALLEDHSVIYQRHDLSKLTGPCNPGHHATLAFPDRAGAGRLSFSPLAHACTFAERVERSEDRGYSWLKPDVEIKNLCAVQGIDGSTTDLSRYPARRGFEDIVILCSEPNVEFAWSSVTFPEEGYVWFSVRDPKQLSSTLLWFSNGGRHFPPWNGRHLNVMGIEDITAFFHVGIAASCRENALSARGICTHLQPDRHGRITIPYIQGVARIPRQFDRVARIERKSRADCIALISESGVMVEARCGLDFLRTGRLSGFLGI
jgi:hypothetical protein